MNSRSELSCEELIQLANKALEQDNQKPLSDRATAVLQGSCEGKGYLQIAEEIGLTGSHVSDIGSVLWQRLSKALGEDVSKSNFLEAFKRYRDRQAGYGNVIHTTPLNTSQTEPTPTPRELPEGLVPLDSHFYIERYNVKSLCNQIKQPGALLRFKAPQKMGKTSELERIIAELKKQGYEVVKLSFASDRSVFSDLYRFTQYFCVRVSKLLKMGNQLDIYWDNDCSFTSNVTKYFEEYLLAGRSKSLVLVLDNFDFVFERSKIADDICGMLRDWHNNLAKQSDECGAIWKKLRLIIVHSTDVYGSLNITDSPLNGVGWVVALEEFNREQVIELTRRYEFDFTETEIDQLMYWFGGHPYLLRLALDHLKYDQVSLNRLLQIAPTAKGPFRVYLQHHLGILEQDRELATAFQRVIRANAPISIRPIVAFKLESMGLVKMKDDDYWIPSCNLFYQYFLTHLENFLLD